MTPLRIATTLFALGLLPAQVSVEREFVAMGTSLAVTIEAADRPGALRASEAAVRAIEAVEIRLSVWRDDSEVSRINAARSRERVAVSADTAADLRWAFAVGQRVHGAFDPTMGPLIEAYDLRGRPRWPTAAVRSAAAAAVGRAFFRIDDTTVTRLRAEAALDCDAFGKGIALDRALAAAISNGATKVWFDFGGQVMSGGANATDTELTVADPEDRSRTFGTMVLPAGHSAATSGNGERRAEVGGRTLGHLLDPRTGLPAHDFGSVTVVAKSAALADAAATALFVLGPERGPAVARQLDIQATFAVRDTK